jgi:hypothetical protein
MCQVFKSAKLKEIDSELVTKHADAEVMSFPYPPIRRYRYYKLHTFESAQNYTL